MAEFVFIENYHKAGKLGINRKCFEKICSVVTNKISGVSTKEEKKNSNPMFTFDKPVRCDVCVHVCVYYVCIYIYNI